MLYGRVNEPVEVELKAQGRPGAAAADAWEVDVVFRGPDGRAWRVPAFHAGGAIFRARFAAPAPGRYAWRAECAAAQAGLDGRAGELDVAPYDGPCELLRRGRLRVAAGRRTLEHADGTPFLWLGDTWWMGLTKRLDWPHGFRGLALDRARKGFNVIQIVAGPLPDYCATVGTWDPGQTNEAGWPWRERPGRDARAEPQPADFAGIDPAFYDLADLRIAALVEAGLVPCLVSMWGYYLPFMGVENVKRHWRHLVARYAAWPAVWCLAGEVVMPTYAFHGTERGPESAARQKEGWADVARFLRRTDPFGNPITAHPGSPPSARRTFDAADLLDLDMLQTGHSGYHSLRNSLAVLDASRAAEPPLPVLNGEACYEGIQGGSRDEVQRFLFWGSLLSGACGHTYGAQGIWAMNSRDLPFRGTTMNWGDGVWQDVMHYAGSTHVGHGARFLRRYPWERFEVLETAPANAEGCAWTLRGAGVPGVVRMHYFPALCIEPGLWGGRQRALLLREGERYARAFHFNPRTGATVDAAVPAPAGGRLDPPRAPSMDDWVLVLENPGAAAPGRAGGGSAA